MSGPVTGRYIICSRLTNGHGSKLAATFNGYKRAVGIEPLTRAQNQIWDVQHWSEDSNYYALRPVSDKRIQCDIGFKGDGPDDRYVEMRGGGVVLWIVKEDFVQEDFTIQLGSEKWYWSVRYAGSVGPEEDVVLTTNNLGMGSHWSFEKVR